MFTKRVVVNVVLRGRVAERASELRDELGFKQYQTLITHLVLNWDKIH